MMKFPSVTPKGHGTGGEEPRLFSQTEYLDMYPDHYAYAARKHIVFFRAAITSPSIQSPLILSSEEVDCRYTLYR